MNMREEFEKWFIGVESGDDENWREPEYASDEWNDYIARRQLAKGAWESAWQAAQPKWIKCSEQMPPLGELVLVVASVSGNMLRNLYEWDGNVWRDFAGRLNPLGRDLISHWMPLPNPPED